MNNFVKIEVYLRSNVTFYSIRQYIDGLPEEKNETEKFLLKLEKEGYSKELFMLNTFITVIGKLTVRKEHCRFEGRAGAFLPPKKILQHTFPELKDKDLVEARLYLYRLNEKQIVLLSGCIKTKLKVQKCPNCSSHFRKAERLSKIIDKSISDREIDPNDFENSIVDLEIPT